MLGSESAKTVHEIRHRDQIMMMMMVAMRLTKTGHRRRCRRHQHSGWYTNTHTARKHEQTKVS